MKTTTYYNLNIVAGTDLVNPLTVDNPNYQKIDEAMHDNAVAGVTLASELTNSTIHALTRENSDCSVIRFIATSRWKAGDSVTVDGVPVLALLPSGETLPDGAYVINANVLCVLTGTNLTVYVGKSATDANEIAYHDTNVGAELDKLNTSLHETNTSLQETNASLQETNASLREVKSELSLIGTSELLKDFSVDSSGNVVLDGNISDYKLLILGIVAGVQYINPTMLPVDIFKAGLSINCEYWSNGRISAQLYYVDDTTVTTDWLNIPSGVSIRLYGVK